MKVVVALAATVLAAGCGAHIGSDPNVAPGGTGGDNDSSVDSGITPGTDGSMTAPIDAPSLCPNHRKVFLEFAGVTLTKAATSDSTANTASWVGIDPQNPITTARVPASALSSANQAQVVAAIEAYLMPFNIDVVTTRPAAPYVMVVFGGTKADTGVPFSIAVNTLDCGDVTKNDVAWVSDTTPLGKVPSFAIGAIGYGLGLTATNDPGDCMCGWGNNCAQSNAACTLSTQIAAQADCQGTSQDEVTQFSTEFCSN